MDNPKPESPILSNPVLEEALLQIQDEKQRETMRKVIKDLVQTMRETGESLQKRLIG